MKWRLATLLSIFATGLLCLSPKAQAKQCRIFYIPFETEGEVPLVRAQVRKAAKSDFEYASKALDALMETARTAKAEPKSMMDGNADFRMEISCPKQKKSVFITADREVYWGDKHVNVALKVTRELVAEVQKRFAKEPEPQKTK